jgi:tRNA(fMet)-specific endonuclease VapC
MTIYLLDTNIASHIIKGDIESIVVRLSTIPIGDVGISVITEAELRYGVEKQNRPSSLTARVEAFLMRVEIFPWDTAAAHRYASLRSQSEKKGVNLGSMDMLIAAHALSTSSTLVTRDKAFSRVPDIIIEDWA